MANSAKLREQARKHESKDQWREAIAAYRQIVEEPEGGEVDISLWNRIGDLHLRLNETEQGVEAYEAAVNAYADVGLHNNAIALCRKILRLVPGRASVYLKLGQISAAKGFLADARQNFLEYAERMQRAGKLDASFTALKEFADLFPEDTDVRRLLADQLASHDRAEEAVDQLRILISALQDSGDFPAAQAVRDQIRALDPDASTEPLERSASAAKGGDDFHVAFHTHEEIALDASPRTPGVEPTAAGDLTLDSGGLGEIQPLEGLETTHAPEPAPLPVPEATRADESSGLMDFRIEPIGRSEVEEEADDSEPLELEYLGDVEAPAEEEEAPPGLPLLDFSSDFGGPPTDEAEDDGSPTDSLPMMDMGDGFDFAPPPAPTPRMDRLEELREQYESTPEDGAVREQLLAELTSRGSDHEAVPLLEAAHRALAARGAYVAAFDTVSALLPFRPGDGAVLQKRVEYAFRSGERPQLIAAYLALGRHLQSIGEMAKGGAVFQRVLELDPANEEARAAVAPPPPPAATVAPAEEYIDLGALIMEDEPEEGSTRFVVEEREPTGDEDRDFADMLSHFRQKVAENIEVEDSASHYDLGTAFKEMGLIDEAIAEFQVALRGGANPLATLEVLGQCFVEKGQYAVASRVLDRALRITGATDADLVGVLYQLGRSEEAMGHLDAARDHFERVLSIDIRFRDTAARLDALRGAGAARRV